MNRSFYVLDSAGRSSPITYVPRLLELDEIRERIHEDFETDRAYIRRQVGVDVRLISAHSAFGIEAEVLRHLYVRLRTGEGERVFFQVALFTGTDVAHVFMPEGSPGTSVGRFYRIPDDVQFLCCCGILGHEKRCAHDATRFLTSGL